ncbi:MAG: TonB family protein [Candidatus Sulfotelmatobacter sp.]|jgi:protein TonB
MGFQALLFCPDDKTARSVTQVLSELEFNVESCNEPFAAVKKLMGTHFDAIVVDCDNEQNAALLFKSARNSTSNQASLAVAVVEGQAGVAKAFRIGANLVLTKPINIEQAKGTLRVARGLLRKGDPAKPAAPAATAAAPGTSVAAPAKAPASAPAARPATPAVAKPTAVPARPAPAASASAASVVPAAVKKIDAPVLPAAKSPVAAVPAMHAPAAEASPVKSAAHAPSASWSSGAASAPAPAREILEIPPVELKPTSAPREDDEILEAPGAERPSASTESAKNVPAPSFTFGGANAPAKSGGAKKVVLVIAAAVIVAVGSYAGWTYYQGRANQNQPVKAPMPAKVADLLAEKPSGTQPAPAPAAAALEPQPASQPAATTTAPAPSAANDDSESASEESAPPAAPTSVKPKSSSSPASKAASAAAPAPEPLVVKGGAAPAKTAPAEPDAQAPSVIGIAAAGSSGPMPNLGTTDGSKPVLQRLNISQGVSTGLLIKKVDPVYPPTALHMRVEGAVQLMATVSKTGDITQVQVLSGDQQLTQAAVDAVKRWKYKPYLLNGEPVEIQTQVTINFRLPH